MRTVCIVLLAAWAGLGCVPVPPGDVPGPRPGLPVRHAPLVTPDQVTEDNGHEVAGALEDELDDAQRQAPPGPKAP
jgi:hypothetical protein